MMRAGAAPVGLARERAEDAPRRVAAARAEWKPLARLARCAREWRDLVARALEPNVFYDPAFALPAARVFGTDAGAVLVWSKSCAAPDRAVPGARRAPLRRDGDAHRLDASLRAVRRAAGRSRRGGGRDRRVPRSCRGGAQLAEAGDAAADRARRRRSRPRLRACWRGAAGHRRISARMRARCSRRASAKAISITSRTRS